MVINHFSPMKSKLSDIILTLVTSNDYNSTILLDSNLKRTVTELCILRGFGLFVGIGSDCFEFYYYATI